MNEFMEHALAVAVGFIIGTIVMEVSKYAVKKLVVFIKYLRRLDNEEEIIGLRTFH